MSVLYTAYFRNKLYFWIKGAMEEFHVIQPTQFLVPYVKQYWFLSLKNVEDACQRLIPFGCPCLFFMLDEGIHIYKGRNPVYSSCLYGQQVGYTDLIYRDSIRFIAVIFQPAGAMALFNLPLAELTAGRITLEELGDKGLIDLEKRLKDISDYKDAVTQIEHFLISRLQKFQHPNYERLLFAIQEADKDRPEISSLARATCLGYKQFKRIFSENIGINPKEYLRILRFQRTLDMLHKQPFMSLSELAFKGGYYDKSHLIRDFKNYSGYTPGEFLITTETYSPYHSLFRSAFLDVTLPDTKTKFV